ncbi:porin [Sporocytophaga myxococcoides]|uniref:porin n=1 Tax=Sporocytophaga myxococcoides TaxID=153721 RepID=UPI00048EBAF0|nr:porin [Sporocytophaga myxococcoides]
MDRLIFLLVFIFMMNNSIICPAQESDSLIVKDAPDVSFWGFADIYYGYNFNLPPSRVDGELVTGNSFLYSHNRHNEFNLNNGIAGVDYINDKMRGILALQAGTYVEYNYSNEPVMLRFIYEAYGGYQPIKNLWIDAGIFTSHLGAESAISSEDLTLSRSMMAENSPYYETGVRAAYDVSDKLLISCLVLNGWQNITDHNKNKALGTQIQFKPSENLLMNYSTFYGKEVGAYEQITGVINTDSLSTPRFFNNFYCRADIARFTLLGAFDIGLQRKRKATGNYLWFNPNLILSYSISDKLSAVARCEYYNDKNGVIIYTGTQNGFQTFSGSFGLNFKLAEYLLWRIEGKVFDSKDKVFLTKDNQSDKSVLVLSSVAVKF